MDLLPTGQRGAAQGADRPAPASIAKRAESCFDHQAEGGRPTDPEVLGQPAQLIPKVVVKADVGVMAGGSDPGPRGHVWEVYGPNITHRGTYKLPLWYAIGMRERAGGLVVAVTLALGAVLAGCGSASGGLAVPHSSCSTESGWCATATQLSSGLGVWEVTCGRPPGAHADLSLMGCPPVDIRVLGPIDPPQVAGTSLPALSRGTRVLPVDAGQGAVNCVSAEWCLGGGGVFQAAPGSGLISSYVPPETYCEASCSSGGWHLELQGVALGRHWALQVNLPKSGAPAG